jgi:hypothetical protein
MLSNESLSMSRGSAKVGTATVAGQRTLSHLLGEATSDDADTARLVQPITLVIFGKINSSVVAKRMSPA